MAQIDAAHKNKIYSANVTHCFVSPETKEHHEPDTLNEEAYTALGFDVFKTLLDGLGYRACDETDRREPSALSARKRTTS